MVSRFRRAMKLVAPDQIEVKGSTRIDTSTLDRQWDEASEQVVWWQAFEARHAMKEGLAYQAQGGKC